MFQNLLNVSMNKKYLTLLKWIQNNCVPSFLQPSRIPSKLQNVCMTRSSTHWVLSRKQFKTDNFSFTLLSCGLWHHIVWYVVTDFSEKHTASIFWLQDWGICSSKTLVATHQTTWCHNQKYHNMSFHHHKNLNTSHYDFNLHVPLCKSDYNFKTE
jgi:hypothetical protein